MNTFFLRSLFLLFLCFCIQIKSHATHLIGGEISVRWTGVDKVYQITLNKYVNNQSTYNNSYGADPKIAVNFSSLDGNAEFQLDLYLNSNNIVYTNASNCTNPSMYVTSLQVYTRIVNLSNYYYSPSSAFFNVSGNYRISWKGEARNHLLSNIMKRDAYNDQFIYLFTLFDFSTVNNSPVFRPLGNEFFCNGEINYFDLSATDTDGDQLIYKLVSPQTNLNTSVLWKDSNTGSNPIPGSVPLKIDPNTGVVSFNPSKNGVFLFGIQVEEFRNGISIGEVRKDYQFNVQNCVQNKKPVIAFQNSSIKNNDTLTVQLKGSTCFPMYVTDLDATQSFIDQTIYTKVSSTLPAHSTNAAYPTAGFTIPAQLPLTGFRDTARFNACFDPCAGGLLLEQTAYYPFKIIINDDRCPTKYDTLIFTIKVEVNANTVPAVFIDPPTDPKSVKVNEVLNFKVYGSDVDAGDLLSLRIDNPQREMFFTNVKDSSSTISSNFSWTPNCNDLNPGIYDVYFIIADNSCLLHTSDTVRQTIIVEQDEVSFDGMQVTNLITPNGDGLNDYYHIPGIPIGNCDKYFKGIEIYNRWGSRVFYSEDRLFKWYPDVSDGMYYFSIDLNSEVQKGWLQITQ